jgi:hypothetical protein
MDPGIVGTSWRNVMHAVMFVVSSVTLTPGLLVLSVVFARDPGLRPHRRYTLITPLLMGLASLDVGSCPLECPSGWPI